MKLATIARNLFQWNAKNLVHDAHLKKSEIGQYFADSFVVRANCRTYDANHDNYFEFLNGFRSTIRAISYEFDDFITENLHIVIPMKAHIMRIDESTENFEAILILQFNQICTAFRIEQVPCSCFCE
jgi:hypothetical protein